MYNLVYDQAPDPDGPEAIDAALLLKQLHEEGEEVRNNGHYLMARKDKDRSIRQSNDHLYRFN
jgi:hypothetical protein